jgi:hypothetical protein
MKPKTCFYNPHSNIDELLLPAPAECVNSVHGKSQENADPDPHFFVRTDPDPNYFEKLDPDPHHRQNS